MDKRIILAAITLAAGCKEQATTATVAPMRTGIRVTPGEVFKDFRKDEKAARTKYSNKVLCIHGTVTEHGMTTLQGHDQPTYAPCFMIQNLIGPGGLVNPANPVKLSVCWANPLSPPDYGPGKEVYLTCKTPQDEGCEAKGGCQGNLGPMTIIHGCDDEDYRCAHEPSPFTDPNVIVKDGRVGPKASASAGAATSPSAQRR